MENNIVEKQLFSLVIQRNYSASLPETERERERDRQTDRLTKIE